MASFHTYDVDAIQLNSIQLLGQTSKQRVICAQQCYVTMLIMTSLHCHSQSRQLS